MPLGLGRVASGVTATHVYTSACKLEVVPRIYLQSCLQDALWVHLPYNKNVELHLARTDEKAALRELAHMGSSLPPPPLLPLSVTLGSQLPPSHSSCGAASPIPLLPLREAGSYLSNWLPACTHSCGRKIK